MNDKPHLKEQFKNTGFNLDKEREDAEDTDWLLGADTPKSKWEEATGLVSASFAWIRPDKNGIYQKVNNRINHCWCFFQENLAKYFPVGQLQNLGGEKYNCVANGFNNEIEKQLNYAYDKKLLSVGLLNFFNKYNFFDVDGKIRLSNRIPAHGSGTTKNGNSLKAVVKWISKNGIFPQSLYPEDVPMTFEEYYNDSIMTQEVLIIGKESKKYLKINYAKVTGVKNFLQYAGNFMWKIFDNYRDSHDGDFIKQLAENYIIMNYGYKLIINETGSVINEPVKKNSMSLQTIKFKNDNRIFAVCPANEKELMWIKDNDGTSWNDYKFFLDKGIVALHTEVDDVKFPQYTIVGGMLNADMYAEVDTNPYKSKKASWWKRIFK